VLLGLNGGTELPFILSLYGGEDATVIASLASSPAVSLRVASSLARP